MIQVHGNCGISALVVADSISPTGVRMTTFEFVYPRVIHGEVMTHRMLSKNAASTRAVPVDTVIKMIEDQPAMMVHWGKNNPGMSSKEELTGLQLEAAKQTWVAASKSAISFVKVLIDKTGINGHKQWAGRLLEPWSMMKTVISGTEWANFIWLRAHPDAQPEFQELARCVDEALKTSEPQALLPGEWHLPYVPFKDGEYWTDEETTVSLEEAKMVSVSCCAQVSYRKLDDTLDKAKKIFGMLNIGSKEKPSHSSPLEHQATPMKSSSVEHYSNMSVFVDSWEPGITHMRKDLSLWSGNLKGWIQFRQTIPNEAKW